MPGIDEDPEHGFDPLAVIPAKDRTAATIATGIGGFSQVADAVSTTEHRGPRKLSPFTFPSFLANLAVGHVSITHGFHGPICAPVTACAAEVQATDDAVRMIRADEADITLCGGRCWIAGYRVAGACPGTRSHTSGRTGGLWDQAGMDLVRLTARPMATEYALSNGFGFGGVNASLLLKQWND